MLPSVDARRAVRLALARGQIALGALALRAGLDLGMLEGPPLAVGVQAGSEFDELLKDGHDSPIEYRIDRPKHEFLSYLVHARGYLLHGTGSPQLEEIRPTRATDYDARSVDAVFATSDGIWRSSSRHWIGSVPARSGTGASTSVAAACSVATTSSSRRPIPGTSGSGGMARSTSCLGRRSCARIPNEWACSRPVLPLAKLAVSPADFPFRSRVLQLDRHLSLIANLRRLRAP